MERRMSQPLVSIITPSYNQAGFLEETMRSVLEQDYPHIEYIVIDGGLTDGSVEILRRYEQKLAYWVSEPDKGQTEAINKGFARARGEILAWINSDDTYQPGAISAAVRELQARPQAALVYADTNFIDGAGCVIGKFPAAQTDYAKLRRGYVHIPQQASFFRADLWKQVGPLDPTFYFAMDYDLWVRLARLAPLVYVPGQVWANFRLHGNSKTMAENDRCWPEMVRVHRRDGGSWLSVLTLKYVIRRAIAPLWHLRLQLRLKK
jgi:glycosyltransferase involved in cell wall biosynthesis